MAKIGLGAVLGVGAEMSLPDWEWPIVCLAAEDAFSAATSDSNVPVADPELDPRLSTGWTVRGTVTAQDAILRLGPLNVGAERVFYGWLLESKATVGEFVLVIRGTDGITEWIEDAGFMPMEAHPVAGRVETGFYSIYATMQLDGKPLVAAVLEAVGAGTLTITGHSLGAALATYAAFELGQALGSRAAARLVASPHPGDAEFSRVFGRRVADHLMWANVADIVPKVPAWFGYCPVPRVELLNAKAAGLQIGGGLAGQHHALSYACLLAKSLPQPEWLIPEDQPMAALVREA